MSIKLDKEKNEKENIKTIIKQSLLNPNYETEVIIGGNMHLGSNISYQQFKQVFNRIRGKSQFKEAPDQHKLIITFNRKSKYNDLRIIINGFTAINAYCINEKIDNILSSVEFQRKTLVNETLKKINVVNYNFKINQKIEENIDIDNSLIRECLKNWRELDKIYRYKKTYRFFTNKPNQLGLFSIDCSVVRNSSFADVMMTKEEVMKSDLFHNVVKPREDKRAFIVWWKSLSSKDQVKVRHVQIYHKTLKASKCFEAQLEYELEIELHQDKILNYYKSILNLDTSSKNLKTYDNTKKLLLDLNNEQRNKIIDYIFALFFENVGICLQCCQSSFYLINNNESYNIIKDFKKLTNQSGNNNSLFFGSLPIDLNLENTIEYHNDIITTGAVPSIIYDYAVSEKIDGERCLLYIAKDGECFLIERNGDVLMRRMGLTMSNNMANTIIDGEYVEYDKAGVYLNKFYGFDCYFFTGKNVMDMPFSTNKGKTDSERLFYLNRVISLFKEGSNIKSENKNMKTSVLNFKIDRVSFHFGESSITPIEKRRPELIFQYCYELLNKMNVKYGGLLEEGHLYSYHTDGLIFTPCLKGVYEKYNYNFESLITLNNLDDEEQQQNNNSNDRHNINNNTDIVDNNRNDNRNDNSNTKNKSKKGYKPNKTVYGKKWDSFFKWKPKDYLTMDLQVRITKKANSTSREVHYEDNKSYAIATLLTANYFNNSFNASKNSMSAITVNHNRNLSREGELIPIASINPTIGTKQQLDNGIIFVDTVHQCYLPISTFYEDEIRCDNDDIIYDGNVVEFKYDNNETNEMMRWKPLRVRPGKKANALNTCLDIWQLMNKSLSTNDIINYNNIQNVINNADNQLLAPNIYLPPITGNNEYQIITNGIYKYMIINNSSSFSNPYGMVLGCGNMHDFGNYIDAKFNRLVCMDHNSRVLNDKTYGAGVIVSKFNTDKGQKLRYNTLFINVDVSKDLMEPLLGNDVVDELNKYYLDVIYGREKASSLESKKLKRFENMGVEGVHIIVGGNNILNIMYENEDKLNGFIDNIAKNLRDQGIFMTTFIDGYKVCELINTNQDKKHTSRYYKDETSDIIYELNGNMDNNYDLKEGFIPTGLGYSRYVKGLSSYQNEYVVDSGYFEKLCLEKGLRLLECKELTEEPGSYYDECVLLSKGLLGDNYKNERMKEYFSLCKTMILQKDNSLINYE